MPGEVVADLVAKLGLVPNEGEWKRGDELIGGLKKAAAGLAAFFAVVKIKDFVGETVEAASASLGLAQKLGISAESVQELNFAAKETGSSIEEMAHGLEKLSKGLVDDLHAGTGPALDALNRMGIGTDEIKGKMAGPGGLDDVLNLVANKVHGMPDGMTKTALAMDLFGRSGANLIPLLNKGSDGIADLRKEAHDLGAVIATEDAKQLKSAGLSWEKAKTAVTGVGTKLVTAFAPELEAASQWLEEQGRAAIAWIEEHKEDIRAAAQAIGKVFVAIGKVVYAIFQAIVWVVETIAEVIGGIIDLAGGIADALGDAFDWLSAQMSAFWKWLKLKAGETWEWIKGKARGFANTVIAAGQKIVDFFVNIARTIADAFEAAFDRVIAGAKKAGSFIRHLPGFQQLGDIGEWIGGKAADSKLEDVVDPDITIQEADGTVSRPGSKAAPASPGPTSYIPYALPRGGGPAIRMGDLNLGGITVNAPAGVDAQAVASLVHARIGDHVSEFWDNQMSLAGATVEDVG